MLVMMMIGIKIRGDVGEILAVMFVTVYVSARI